MAAQMNPATERENPRTYRTMSMDMQERVARIQQMQSPARERVQVAEPQYSADAVTSNRRFARASDRR
jgi:hypothetical protein